MAVDFNKFGKSTSATTQTPQYTGSTSTAVATPTPSTGKIDFNKFGKASTSYTAPVQPEADGIVKSLVRPVATMVARPVQLGAAIAGVDEDTLDKFSKEKLGGYVAPVVRNMDDFTKEVGRAAQTVSFGLGAPKTLLAGGAMMGAGASLENNGTDTFTTPEGATELAVNTAIGMAGGKLIDKFGAPVLNKVGMLSGKIAGPALSKAVSNTAGNIAGKVGGYMEKTELPLVSKFSKPASEAITKGAEAFDTGTNKLFTGAKNTAGKAITTWQPGLSKENQTKHWVEKESKDMLNPVNESGPAGKRFSDAQEIHANAQEKGIDIADQAIKSKVFTDDIMEGGHYNSADAAKVERESAAKESSARMRLALEEADQETPRIAISDIKDRMIAEANAIPDNRISTEARAERIAKIERLYGEDSAAAKKYKDGYSLTDLHNNKITKSGEAKYNPLGSSSDAISAKDAEHQASVFRTLLEERAPARLNIKQFNKEIQARFTLANYLDAIHGKKVNEGIAKRFLRQTSRVGGFIAGSSFGGGYLAGLGGSHLSSGAIDLFEGMSNPIKMKALREMKINEPEVFKEFELYIKASRDAREARLLLGDGNSTLRPKAKADTATKAKVSAILQKQQNEKGAIPLNQYYKPLTDGERVANDFKQNMRASGVTKQLPAPANRLITPNRQGTPNPTGKPYSPKDVEEVGGMRQRIGDTKLFKGETKKKVVSEPVQEKVSEPVKSTEPKVKKEPAQKYATKKSIKEAYEMISRLQDDKTIAGQLRKIGVSEENIDKKKNLLVSEKNPKTIKDIVDSVVPKNPVNTTKKQAPKIDSKDVVGEKTEFVSKERDNVIDNYRYFFEDISPEYVSYPKTDISGTEYRTYRTSSSIPKDIPDRFRTRVMFNEVKPYWEAQVRPTKKGKAQELYDILQKRADAEVKENKPKKKSLKDYYEF